MCPQPKTLRNESTVILPSKGCIGPRADGISSRYSADADDELIGLDIGCIRCHENKVAGAFVGSASCSHLPAKW